MGKIIFFLKRIKNKMILFSSILLLLASNASAAVPSLTPENYDSMTEGKTVFIKFFAPWCGHCKKMAPDWEKLSEEWEGNDVGLVAEVDCTTDAKSLCETNGVKGFPTLKWGDPSALEDYQGGRSLEDLQKFATENLKPVCSPTNLDLCDDEKKATIEKYMAMPVEELEKKIEEEIGKINDAEENFMDEKDNIVNEVMASGLSTMKSVKALKSKAEK